MSGIIDNIKEYFKRKQSGESVESAPKEMCAICWGYNEWDGKFYEVVRDKHLTPGGDRYDSFISKIVEKHIKTTHKHENKYICTSCDKEIK